MSIALFNITLYFYLLKRPDNLKTPNSLCD